MLKKTVKIFLSLTFAFAIYLTCLYAIQDYLIFYPDRDYVGPDMAGVSEFEERPLVTADGHLIMGWYARGDKDKPLILFFHGNAGQLAVFAPMLRPYIESGYSVFMPEYRGFAHSGGKLTQDTMYADAVVAFDYVKQELNAQKVVVFGYSMGTAPASAVSVMREPDALVIAAPFLSLEKEVKDKPVPFASLVLKNELPSENFIAKYDKSLLVLHGREDKLILPYHGQKMYEISPSENKCLKLVDGIDHNQLFFKSDNHEIILEWLNKMF